MPANRAAGAEYRKSPTALARTMLRWSLEKTENKGRSGRRPSGRGPKRKKTEKEKKENEKMKNGTE